MKSRIDQLIAAVKALAPRPTAPPRAVLFLPEDGSGRDIRRSDDPARVRIFGAHRFGNLMATGVSEGEARRLANDAHERGEADDALPPPDIIAGEPPEAPGDALFYARPARGPDTDDDD